MQLSPSERVLVHRLTQRLPQWKAANQWGVGFWIYRSWETNPNSVPDAVRKKLSNIDVPKHIRYVILRRREGMTQSDLAYELGVSRQWVNRMEQGIESDSRLRDYWGT